MPSVIESPNATIPRASAGTIMSSALRKYQDAVLNGKAFSSSLSTLAPAPGAVKYEVVSALACQVIGPLSPMTWKLTASLGAGQLSRRGIVHEGQGHRVAPHRTTGAYRSRALAGEADRLVAADDSAASVRCKPTWMPSKVTGLVPSALENLSRI